MRLCTVLGLLICFLVLIDDSSAWRRRRRRRRVSCVVNSWSHWGSCSVSCGRGRQLRSRSIKVQPYGGSPCPSRSEYKTCNIAKRNCVVSSWKSWGSCTRSCGSGTQTRTRSIIVRPASCGAACPTLINRRACTGRQCPRHCAVSAWTSWSSCSVTCGSGRSTRSRKVTISPSYGGKACPGLNEHRSCAIAKRNCLVSSWGTWSRCGGPCTSGKKTRSRRVLTHSLGCGSVCPALSETHTCLPTICVKNCAVSSWSAWSSCSVSCGSGISSRGRKVTVASAYGGKVCPSLNEHKRCSIPVQHCRVSSWSSWGICHGSCPTGSQQRTRHITVSASGCGISCPITADTRQCVPANCVKDCQVSSWSIWSACSATCGNGHSSRSRKVTQPSEHGGKACPELTNHKHCSVSAVNCVVSSWSSWGMCSSTCGAGNQARSRTIILAPRACGKLCPTLTDSKPCTNSKCTCKMSSWSAWSTCSCSGTKTRSRKVLENSYYTECDSQTESAKCEDRHCPVDCKVNGWGVWSKCSTFCGVGKQSRSRTVHTAPSSGGKGCPEKSETRECNPPCPTDCKWNFWSEYGKCGCQSKEQLRHRTIKQPSLFGGKSCDGALEDSIPCTTPFKKCKSKKKKCGKKQFKCKKDGECVKKVLVCNGDVDCSDSSDESKCKNVKYPCGRNQTFSAIPNIQLVGGGFDASSLQRSSEVLDNSLYNGICSNVYSADHKQHFRQPFNLASFAYQVKAVGTFIATSYDSEKSVMEAIQNDLKNRQEYTDSSVQLTQMSQLVGHVAGGNNAKFEKLVKGGYDDDYKYFSVKNELTVAQFKLKQDGLLLNGNFEQDLNKLHSWYDKVEYLRFIEKYGTHYYTEGSLGGKYQFIYKFRKSDLNTTGLTDVEQKKCLEDEAKNKLLGKDVASARCNINSKTFTNSAVKSFSFVLGGETKLASSLSVNSDEKSLTEWTNSVIRHPVIVEYKIAPLSQLIDSRITMGNKKRKNMEAALVSFMKRFEPIRCNSFNNGGRRCRNNARQMVVKGGRECVCLCPAGLYGQGCEVPV